MERLANTQPLPITKRRPHPRPTLRDPIQVAGIDSFSPVTFNFGAEPFAFDLTEAPAALHASSRRMRISRCFGSALL